ncbi:inactive dipeptidyl peptidase 10 isoform X2 [Agrilus planipennis]|uniref:Inactive dipeptidyl peptidase 10 isoform X2 n=1 Tax=Agrilus planipennis TaxID=224129 RepID=A0A1W4WYK1_AGRPL|nr:inactive dipeptidyl peptidase 10 isoform X2 [Agrilus planipennis]
MHTNVHTDRTAWRVPPDETLQVADPKAKKAEELAYHSYEGHNWWSIVFSLLVIGIVISGIVAAILLMGYVDELLYWHGKRMQLDEYLEGGLNPQRLPHTWISESRLVFQDNDGGLAVLNTDKNFSVTLLVTNHTLRQLNVKDYQCSKDLRYVLFQHNVKEVFRQSYTAHYTVYDVSNDHHIPVRLASAPKVQPQRLQYVRWISDTNALLIFYENDIYYRASPVDETDTRLTFTGQPDVIYNGLPDWLYQEDVLKNPEALWCSRDGTHLLYATFNDSDVGTLIFPWFSTGAVLAAGGTKQRAPIFPPSRSVRYPTPGTPNPKVQLWILDISNLTELQRWAIKPPKALKDEDYYLTSAGWIGQSNSQITAVWMNRPQNLSLVSTCFAPNWTCIEIHAERAAENSWLEIQEHPVFSSDGESILLLAAVQEGNTDTFTHIKHVTLSQQHIAVLSHGRLEVTKILAWDTENHLVYYLGTQDHKPGQKHLYVIKDPTTDDPRRIEPLCITCDLGGVLWSSRYYYGNCSHFSASISPRAASSGMLYYLLECEGPRFPLAGLHSARTHKLHKIIYDTRARMTPKLSDFALPKQQFLEVPLTQGNRAQVQLLLPPSWRPELRDAAYPVIVEVNGRPGSKAVTDKFRVDWGTYMSSHCDVVYIRLDVRGSLGQSSRALYHRLGGIEVQDQITVLQHLLEKYSYLDKTRIGLWGWGYGGYVTSMVLGTQQKIFKCGIAVNPITDWLYFNSAFTERILGLPTENYKGYVESDATQRAKLIPSMSLYLIHGLADLTAPYQHGISLATALADAGVLFRYQSYADEGHKLDGVIKHVYRSMEDYFQECLSLDTDDPKASPAT